MTDKLLSLWFTLLATIWDILPIIAILVGAQVIIIRRRIANLPRVLLGFFFVLIGLTFFLEGLERALFPIGKLMAEQLTAPAFLGLTGDETSDAAKIKTAIDKAGRRCAAAGVDSA